jgi:hypothetical protein
MSDDDPDDDGFDPDTNLAAIGDLKTSSPPHRSRHPWPRTRGRRSAATSRGRERKSAPVQATPSSSASVQPAKRNTTANDRRKILRLQEMTQRSTSTSRRSSREQQRRGRLGRQTMDPVVSGDRGSGNRTWGECARGDEDIVRLQI